MNNLYDLIKHSLSCFCSCNVLISEPNLYASLCPSESETLTSHTNAALRYICESQRLYMFILTSLMICSCVYKSAAEREMCTYRIPNTLVLKKFLLKLHRLFAGTTILHYLLAQQHITRDLILILTV